MGYLSRRISNYGKKLFTEFMERNGTPLRHEDNNWVDDHYYYSIRTKRSTLHQHRDGSGKSIVVQGINEEALVVIRKKGVLLNKKVMIVFIDLAEEKINKITLSNWDHGVMFEDVYYPMEHLSGIGGKIMYFPIYHLQSVCKLKPNEVDHLRKLTIRNKSAKGQGDLFI